jgi:exodeoxyribonuclease VII small subunit
MAGKAGRPPQDSEPKDFESALSELEALVSSMETGQLSLEKSLSSYRRGMELISFCQRVLQAAEQEVKVLEAGGLKDLTRGDAADDESSP